MCYRTIAKGVVDQIVQQARKKSQCGVTRSKSPFAVPFFALGLVPQTIAAGNGGEKQALCRSYFFLPFFLAGAGFFGAAFFGAGFLAAGLAGAFAGVDFSAAAFFAGAGGAPFCLASGAGCFA